MKKTILLAVMFMISIVSFCQKKDSVTQLEKANVATVILGSHPKIQEYFNKRDASIGMWDGVILSLQEFFGIDSLKKANRKADTVLVPVPLYERTDTLPATFVYGDRKLIRGKGWALIHGFKIQKGNVFEWVQQPTLAGVLDERKRIVPDVVNGTLVIQPNEGALQQKK